MQIRAEIDKKPPSRNNPLPNDEMRAYIRDQQDKWDARYKRKGSSQYVRPYTKEDHMMGALRSDIEDRERSYYFQAPNFDINPESATAPKLGSIFPTLDTLTAPLNQFDHINPPADLINTSSSANFNESTDTNIEVSAGLQATAAYGVAGSGELVYIFARDKQNIYHCDLLETTEFSPTTEFVAECV